MPGVDYIRWLRGQVGHARVILAYASAILTDGAGRVLLQRRSDFPWWGLPGGVLERGETLHSCAAREVREETGLEVTPRQLVGVYSSPDFDVVYPNGDQVQQFTACFACQKLGGQLQPDGEEILDLCHFPPQQLPQVPPWYRAMIEDFTTGARAASFCRGRPGGPRSQNYALELRRQVGEAPLIVVGANAWVRDDAGAILLVRRTDDGTWTLPGGTMELGERIDQTVIREVEEEAGLQVQPDRLAGLYSGPAFFHTYPNGDPVHVVLAVFACHTLGGELRADQIETRQARFFPPTRLPPLSLAQRICVEDALKRSAQAAWR